MNAQTLARLESLIDGGRDILDSATIRGGQLRTAFVTGNDYRTPLSYHVDTQAASKWRISCLHFLEMLFGLEDRYYKSFDKLVSNLSHEGVKRALGVLEALKDDLQQEIPMPTIIERTENAGRLGWITAPYLGARVYRHCAIN